MFFRKAKNHTVELTEEIEKDPLRYSAWVIKSVGGKAERYKTWSRYYSILSVILSLFVVFVLMIEGASVFTIIASLITITNSVILAWFQLEKPYDRWRLYRKYHRLFEAERVKYINSIDPYDTAEKDKLLIQQLSDLQIRLHYEWDGLVPSTEDIHKLQKGH